MTPLSPKRRILVAAGVVIGGLSVLIGAAAAVGSTLPREHVVTVYATLAASPDSVWRVISDPLSAPTWRRNLTRVEIIDPSGDRVRWREFEGSEAVTYEIELAVPPSRLVTRIVDDDLPYGGRWEYEIEPAGTGTTVTITERGYVTPAAFRFMARYILGYDTTLRSYLKQLGDHFGESVTPETRTPGL